ncbi:MAG: RES family NAD+ phosphorylase [Gammaproteobacteria bacterium]|nr:RES family NAD+ phosphorylase [Gammaproteobacteria bacterium]
MDATLQQAGLCDFAEDVFRNIVSLKESQDLFDDLSSDPKDQQLALAAELACKPAAYGESPLIHRPFEEADYLSAIQWPFDHWSQSRYSSGRFGVWYGALDWQTTIHETLFHWRHGFLADCGFDRGTAPVVAERKVYRVRCEALLLDLRRLCKNRPGRFDGDGYQETQAVGARLSQQGHPGLLSRSARCAGDVAVLFTPKVLSSPRPFCFLRYVLEPKTGEVEIFRGGERVLRSADPASG